MEPQLFTLVTGASSGIGRSIAIALSQSRHLILHGRDSRRLEETRSQCASPNLHMTWAMNLAEPRQIQATLSELLHNRQMAIESFVHCAGVLRILPMRQMDLKTAYEVMNVNFHSAAEIIRLLLKRAINHHRLRNIVFVSSTASKFGANGFNLYCASKGALDSMMRALAVELAPEIRVNSVLPGGVRTEMTQAMFDDPHLMNRLGANYPLGLGQPSDIAAAVEFLLSERSRWVTGQQLIVDGGRTVNISA